MVDLTERFNLPPGVALTTDDLEFRYKRASGPGGQHVNRTDSAVELRFPVATAGVMPQPVRERLQRIARKRISREGVLIIHAQRFRSQERNREDAVERLVELLHQASVRPSVRIPTRPSTATRERRLQNKHRQAQRKRERRAHDDWD